MKGCKLKCKIKDYFHLTFLSLSAKKMIEKSKEDEQTLGFTSGVRTCEVFLCFVAIVRVRVYCVDFFIFFVLRHW